MDVDAQEVIRDLATLYNRLPISERQYRWARYNIAQAIRSLANFERYTRPKRGPSNVKTVVETEPHEEF